MISRHFPIKLNLSYPLDLKYGTNKIGFFDIETTGLVAETSYLYLIGCIYIKDSSLHMIQWFSEDVSEEAMLLDSFFDFIKDFDLLVHYNGLGFDIPYILKKCKVLGLNHSFKDIQNLDLYKKVFSIRKMLKLSNCKQKTIEAFLKVTRKDKYSGGDLIEVYQAYLGKKQIEKYKKSRDNTNRHNTIDNRTSEADKLLDLLLLHNEDDLKGLVGISPILYYCDLFEKPYHILEARVDKEKLNVSLKYDFKLPIPISFGNNLVYMSGYGESITITIDIYEGELKHFYDKYRDYYYLPEEDRAIHKSLAIFVDTNYREKAKPSNCYTKKQGLFAPQYQTIISPSFKNNHKDKISFVDVHTDLLLDENKLNQYIKHILGYLMTGKS